MPPSAAPVLVALLGPLLLGKSTVASLVHKLVPRSTLVHLDDFYLPDSDVPHHPTHGQNWDCPEAVDWPRFDRFLDTGAQPALLEQPSEMTLSSAEMALLEPLAAEIGPCVLVDGFMLFHNDRYPPRFDVKLLFRAPFDVLKQRRENRTYTTAEGVWVDPPRYFEEVVWAEYQRTHAHLFEGGMEGPLSAHAHKLGIEEVKTEEPLVDIVAWVLERIARECVAAGRNSQAEASVNKV